MNNDMEDAVRTGKKVSLLIITATIVSGAANFTEAQDSTHSNVPSMFSIFSNLCGVRDENSSAAEDGINISAGVDLMSRYIWRGMDFGNAPSLQPALTFSSGNFEFGFWGAYTLTDNASGSDENDFWVSYSFELPNEWTITALMTDYYFPNAGVKFLNFNNHDDPDGAGAHTLEAGLILSWPENMPVTLSVYNNFYNDAGNNTYFELALPIKLSSSDLTFTLGGTTGSTENPGYYGSDDFAIINIGLSTTREIKITEYFTLPLSMSYIVNPEIEMSYLIAGISF